jgi:hypothetical protein
MYGSGLVLGEMMLWLLVDRKLYLPLTNRTLLNSANSYARREMLLINWNSSITNDLDLSSFQS